MHTNNSTPTSHALLSASSAHRWIACPPSALQNAAQDDTTSPYAQEGTDAHTLCEYKLRCLLQEQAASHHTPAILPSQASQNTSEGLTSGSVPLAAAENTNPIDDPRPSLTYFTPEMDTYTDDYATFVLELLSEIRRTTPDPLILIEERLDFSQYVPEGFGTGDCVIIADDLLHIIDFKYGQGVLVNAAENPQMMCYALGALNTYENLYDIHTIRLTIFQPRRENNSTWETTVDTLRAWANDTLAPAANLAFTGAGEYHSGPHCKFCRIKATCRQRADDNMQLAAYDFRNPAELTTEEIAQILPYLELLVAWAGDLKAHALKTAIAGTHYPGYKLVESRTTRRITNPKAAAQLLESHGYDPYEKKLMSLSALTTLLGKQTFEELLSPYVEKPAGAPTLVPENDRRPAISDTSDFENEPLT